MIPTRASREASLLSETSVDREPVTASSIATPQGWFSRHEATLLPFIAVALILLAWEAYGRIVGFNPLFFARPTEIWQGFTELADGPLWEDLRVSSQEFVVGLGIALTAIPLGMLIGSMRRLRMALDPIVNALYATPTLALTPLFVIWFGLGMSSKVAIVAIMAFFPLVINTIEGVKTVDRVLLRAARSFGAKRRHTYTDVVLPSIFPFVISGLRLAIGRAIIGVVIGEFIGATAGIGYRIRSTAAVFQTRQYLASVAVLVIAAVVLNLLLKVAEARLAPWQRHARDSND